MKITILVLLACLTTACSSVKVNYPDTYEHFITPKITVVAVDDDMAPHCGRSDVLGCAVSRQGRCDIFIARNSNIRVLSHELRHCHGWGHSENHSIWFPTL